MITIIGGIDRLKRQYERVCKDANHKAQVFTRQGSNVEKKIRNSDGVIVFTDINAKDFAKMAVKTANKHGVPLAIEHRSSISSLKNCISRLNIEGGLN